MASAGAARHYSDSCDKPATDGLTRAVSTSEPATTWQSVVVAMRQVERIREVSIIAAPRQRQVLLLLLVSYPVFSEVARLLAMD